MGTLNTTLNHPCSPCATEAGRTGTYRGQSLQSLCMNECVRILLVEDSEDDYLLFRRHLKNIANQSYALHWSSSIGAALAVLERQEVDVVLCDFHLGADTGVEFISRVQERRKIVPVILLTGHDTYEVDAQAMAAGAVDCLSKRHVSPQILERSIRYAIERGRREAAERLKAEAERRVLQDQFLQAQKLESVAVLASGIAHDLGNILNGMMACADSVLSETSAGSLAADRLNDLLSTGMRGREILGRLMDFSRKDSAEHSACIPAHVVGEAATLLAMSKPPNVTIRVGGSGDDDARVPLMPSMFYQVVINLGLNALQAVGDRGTVSIILGREEISGGVRASAFFAENSLVKCVTVGQPADGEHVKLTIADDGCGIDGAAMGRIFTPLYTTKGDSRGTGLGLAAVRSIVLGCGGAVTAESRKNHGTAFHVLLPIVHHGG